MSNERPSTPSMTDLATEVIFDIGQCIVSSVSTASNKWRTCYVRAQRQGDDLGLNYFYFEDMTEHNKQLFAIQNKFAFYDYMMELAETTRMPDGARWKVCLCRIQKAIGTVEVSFEFKDLDRWRYNFLD
jgi:hypothetical protein